MSQPREEDFQRDKHRPTRKIWTFDHKRRYYLTYGGIFVGVILQFLLLPVLESFPSPVRDEVTAVVVALPFALIIAALFLSSKRVEIEDTEEAFRDFQDAEMEDEYFDTKMARQIQSKRQLEAWYREWWKPVTQELSETILNTDNASSTRIRYFGAVAFALALGAAVGWALSASV